MRHTSAPLFPSKQLCLLFSHFIKGKLHQIIIPSGEILLLKSTVVVTHALKGLSNKLQFNCYEVTKQPLSCRRVNKNILKTVLKGIERIRYKDTYRYCQASCVIGESIWEPTVVYLIIISKAIETRIQLKSWVGPGSGSLVVLWFELTLFQSVPQ